MQTGDIAVSYDTDSGQSQQSRLTSAITTAFAASAAATSSSDPETQASMRNRPSLTIETFFPKASLVAPRRDTPPLPATHMLPPALWRRILEESEETDQLAALWRRCRQVCRTFRDIVDEIFEKRVLGDVVLEFDLPPAFIDEENDKDKVYFGFEMRFDRFADDRREIAIFKNDVDRTQQDLLWWHRHDIVEKRLLEDKFFFYTPGNATGAEAIDTRFDLPPWTIEIRGKINDTTLPGWKMDYAAKEISFRWKDAMEAFYREAEYIDESVMMTIMRAAISGDYDVLYKEVQEGRISQARHWIETTKIREIPAARARRQIRNHRMERFWRSNYEKDPDKHTYSIDSLLEFRDQEAEEAALQTMREMEWTRSDGLLASIPTFDDGFHPLEDPEVENFIQRTFFDDDSGGGGAGFDTLDFVEFADDDMDFTEGYMTDVSSLATDTEHSAMGPTDFLPMEEDLWTIEEEDASSLEEFESSGVEIPPLTAESSALGVIGLPAREAVPSELGFSTTKQPIEYGSNVLVRNADEPRYRSDHNASDGREIHIDDEGFLIHHDERHLQS